MALTTTVGGTDTDSYVTLSELVSYIEKRPVLADESWYSLSTDSKEECLRIGALVIDSLKFRGIPATTSQARSFPRIYPGDDLWPVDANEEDTADPYYRYETWDDLTDRAVDLDVETPIVPDHVKTAQMEVTMQLVYKRLFASDPSDATSSAINAITAGDLTIRFGDRADVAPGRYSIISGDSIQTDSYIYFLLRKYLIGVRGFLV